MNQPLFKGQRVTVLDTKYREDRFDWYSTRVVGYG